MPLIQEPDKSALQSLAGSQTRQEIVRVKNRRKMYLDRHPSYFTSPDLELSDPLLYDRCIRRFQSAAEREADGKSKGYSGVLEADLYRSEAKIAALKGQPVDGESVQSSKSSSAVSYVRGSDGEVLPEDPDEVPKSREEGFERWKYEMTMKFLRGEDDDFDYQTVDRSGEWDEVESQEKQDDWFDDEEPAWSDGNTTIRGETGIQDF